MKYGSAPKGLRIRKPGNYDRGTFKLTVVLAIEAGDPALPDGVIGSITRPRIWCRIRNIAGTTIVAYASFVEEVLGAYTPVANPDERQVLIHDNYSSHTSPVIFETVRQMGHRVVCRPPYRPHDGPVEFAINQAVSRLRNRWAEVKYLATMTSTLQQIIDNDVTGVNDLFVKCGYRHN